MQLQRSCGTTAWHHNSCPDKCITDASPSKNKMRVHLGQMPNKNYLINKQQQPKITRTIEIGEQISKRLVHKILPLGRLHSIFS